MDALQLELKNRFDRMFAALAGGDDAAPSLRLRAEGLMEAVILSGLADEDAVDAMLGRSYRLAFKREVEEDFGADWRSFYPFPQIPAVGRRAPVYPSTKE